MGYAPLIWNRGGRPTFSRSVVAQPFLRLLDHEDGKKFTALELLILCDWMRELDAFYGAHVDQFARDVRKRL